MTHQRKNKVYKRADKIRVRKDWARENFEHEKHITAPREIHVEEFHESLSRQWFAARKRERYNDRASSRENSDGMSLPFKKTTRGPLDRSFLPRVKWESKREREKDSVGVRRWLWLLWLVHPERGALHCFVVYIHRRVGYIGDDGVEYTRIGRRRNVPWNFLSRDSRARFLRLETRSFNLSDFEVDWVVYPFFFRSKFSWIYILLRRNKLISAAVVMNL